MKKEQGFTLIELLIVIVILGILAGVIIAVINPARQQKRANEGVLKANVDKMALALKACVSGSSAPTTECDTMIDVGVVDPTGAPGGNAVYTISVAANTPAAGQTRYRVSGVFDGCSYFDDLILPGYTNSRSSSATGNGCASSW